MSMFRATCRADVLRGTADGYGDPDGTGAVVAYGVPVAITATEEEGVELPR